VKNNFLKVIGQAITVKKEAGNCEKWKGERDWGRGIREKFCLTAEYCPLRT
jgi:hypothetical protein